MAEQEQCWLYALGSRQIGPLTWEQLVALAQAGGIVRQTLIWKTGMEHWVAAGRVRGLFDNLPEPVRPVGYARLAEHDEKIYARARRFAVVVFTAFVVGLVTLTVLIIEKAAPSKQGAIPSPILLVAYIGALATVPTVLASLIYLPLRWRVIRQLEKNHRFCALVGGFGMLLVLAAIAVVWIL